MIAFTFTFPLAAITLMLWMLWSDSVRPPRRPSFLIYIFRALLFLGVIAALLYNFIVYRHLFFGIPVFLVFLGCVIGIGGAVYFVRKAIRIRKSPVEG